MPLQYLILMENKDIWTDEEIQGFYNNITRETLRRYPVLADYSEILTFVFMAFFRQGGLVRFDEHSVGASVQPGMLKGCYVYDLFIGIKDRVDPITLVWSVLHEYGHTLQQKITDEIHLSPVLKLERETDAWNRAEHKLTDFNISAADLESFRSFREQRLQCYRDKISLNSNIKPLTSQEPQS